MCRVLIREGDFQVSSLGEGGVQEDTKVVVRHLLLVRDGGLDLLRGSGADSA